MTVDRKTKKQQKKQRNLVVINFPFSDCGSVKLFPLRMQMHTHAKNNSIYVYLLTTYSLCKFRYNFYKLYATLPFSPVEETRRSTKRKEVWLNKTTAYNQKSVPGCPNAWTMSNNYILLFITFRAGHKISSNDCVGPSKPHVSRNCFILETLFYI